MVSPQAHARGHILQSATVGALPILNRILDHSAIVARCLRAVLPPEDGRTKL
jgi:hypothetical protein